MKTTQRWLLASALLVATTLAANSCSYFSSIPACLPKVDGSGSATFSFKPLFPKDPKFVVAFDSMTTAEAKGELFNPTSTIDGPYNKVGAWLEYDDPKLTSSSHAISDMVVLTIFSNHTSTGGNPSGGNNGCDGFWSAACSKQLRTSLTAAVAKTVGTSATFSAQLIQESIYALAFESHIDACPDTLWDAIITLNYPIGQPDKVLAVEDGSDPQVLLDSGSSSSMWLSSTTGTSPPDTFLKVGFVGLLVRTPLATANAQPTADKVQLEMVCVKPEPGSDNEESSSGSDSSGSSATSTGGAAAASSSGAAVKGVQQAGSGSLLVGLMGLLGVLGMF